MASKCPKAAPPKVPTRSAKPSPPNAEPGEGGDGGYQSSSLPPRRPPSRLPPARPPSTEPSSLDPPRWGAAAKIREARRENGRLCSHTVPGPVSLARNKPSPPNSAVLILPTYWISKATLGV